MTLCYHYFVSGRVQGVFFRDSTREHAMRLGLAGWVRNRRDGRVEVLVCGDPVAVEEMEKWLEIGPEHAKVANIEREQQDRLQADGTDFTILPTE